MKRRLQEQPPFWELLERIRQGSTQGEKVGLAKAARLPVLTALRDELQVPILLLTGRTDRAFVLRDELSIWEPDLVPLFFPEPDPLFYEGVPWSRKTRQNRIRVLSTLASVLIPGSAEREVSPVILAPARAVMTRTMPRRDFLKATRILRKGQKASLTELARSWIQTGYERASLVIAPGQFARRGGILDIWPHKDDFPARIEFFGDEVEMLRLFDPDTQRTIEIVDEVQITPAREYLLPDELVSAKDDTSEYHIPLFHAARTTLLSYLPPSTLVVVDDWDMLRGAVSEVEEQASSLRRRYLEDGSLEPEYPLPYLAWEDFRSRLEDRAPLILGPVSGPDSPPLSGLFQPNRRFGGELKPFLAHIRELHDRGAKTIIVSRQMPRLEKIWEEHVSTPPSPIFVKGNLENGWMMNAQKGEDVHLFSDGEIFGWERVQPRRRPFQQAHPPEVNFSDLEVGEWVVHIDHGIGRFIGLVHRTLGGVTGEYLAIEYAEGDKLYVPATQADRLSRYVGPDTSEPRITRLGSVRWRQVKSQVKEEVEKVASDLLELYARREVVEGHAFSPDTAWQRELEASFPYMETEDQLRVLEAVKHDMEQPKPMDRLICGDVGYGKTEIAVRAAFKAVMDGKQVAMLVPTTVLAQQHYDTFLERMSAFPVEIRMLSRFRTSREQQEILYDLARGSVDIVIGTHRLLSPDVVFHDLGLLIVDEEQRFGVAHKERIKKMRANIDVLTLTATPIPRTMYMALSGVRDISRIDTPPEERLPVVTHVSGYDPELIQKAIWRELERGGQVFFVHNRVKTISAMENHLKRLVPEANITIAHGQMPEAELAQRMREFTSGKVDVLLSTSIIESGLDIPNANTLIVDRADMFGLAQLYQLRGRVGRGAQRAYAYFFKQRQKPPTPEGQLRLETIAEHTQLGTGYSIAMRDLEIRGAGELLGTRQHGHIAAVGFHLYTRLLADAVRRLREEHHPFPEGKSADFQAFRPLVKVDLPLPTGIPEDYIGDRSVRLGLYRRMADITDISEIHSLREEFRDRFGPIPATVENILLQLRIRLLAEEIGVETISIQNEQITLQYPEDHPLPQRWEVSSDVRLGESTVWLNFNLKDHDWFPKLVKVLRELRGENEDGELLL
ncbi:MAG: transcription-repair coupling factor [Anaerolineales bacterium]